ncbi:ephrin-B3 isoform X1 [Carassius gibelio]|uniref:ephrin-B3 isoform X1 n=1 Tax=Carassius gibelio TaxID=101364 RepID=UPI002278BCB5|nr:ephrin-B3 isoform X1 [Carassius gibelio]
MLHTFTYYCHLPPFNALNGFCFLSDCNSLGPIHLSRRRNMGVQTRGAWVAMAFSDWVSGFGFLLIFLMESLAVDATNMEPVYWNTLNRRFGDERGYILYPQIGDRLDLVCPATSPSGPNSPPEYEYYKLYLVSSREQADRCEVMGAPNLLLTCDKPNSDMRFTIKFQEYSPNLWGHEFKNLRDYYIIATSDGTKEGIDSMRGGVCVTRGMKLVLKVGQTAYGLPPKPKPDPGRPSNRIPDTESGSKAGDGSEAGERGDSGAVSVSNIALITAGAGGAFILLIAVVIAVVCYRRRKAKHSESHHPALTLSSLTPKRGSSCGAATGVGGGNNNGSEPSDIIIPLRTSDSAYCPHYEKVSGDYGHPVYIVQEMPPQSPANIYYKV